MTWSASYKNNHIISLSVPADEDGLLLMNDVMWIFVDADSLKLKLLAVAHTGKACYWGCEATAASLSEAFTWKRLTSEAKHFSPIVYFVFFLKVSQRYQDFLLLRYMQQNRTKFDILTIPTLTRVKMKRNTCLFSKTISAESYGSAPRCLRVQHMQQMFYVVRNILIPR